MYLLIGIELEKEAKLKAAAERKLEREKAKKNRELMKLSKVGGGVSKNITRKKSPVRDGRRRIGNRRKRRGRAN